MAYHLFPSDKKCHEFPPAEAQVQHVALHLEELILWVGIVRDVHKVLARWRHVFDPTFPTTRKACLKGEYSGFFSPLRWLDFIHNSQFSIFLLEFHPVVYCMAKHSSSTRRGPGIPKSQTCCLQLAQSYLFCHPIPPFVPKKRPAQTQVSWVKADVLC